MASSPTYKPSVYAGRVEKSRSQARASTKTAPAKNYPSLDRASMATYPPGSMFKPVTALAAMQERLVSAVRVPAVHGHLPLAERQGAPGLQNWDPNVNQQMDMPTALA